MRYHYEIGTVRWLRHTGGEIRCHNPPKGWESCSDLVERNPVTGKRLKEAEWWIREIYMGVRK